MKWASAISQRRGPPFRPVALLPGNDYDTMTIVVLECV
jgi:hypothetical protein